MKKKRLVYWVLILFLMSSLFIGCASPASEPPEGSTSAEDTGTEPSEDTGTTPEWMKIELTDVVTGEKFTIDDFKGKSVLVESFAVWCPTCLRQQLEIKELAISEHEDIIHISLDTDPSEDADRIREHLSIHNFSWHYAVAPIELSNMLVDEFGLEAVAAPAAPVILICPDQSARLLQTGVKSSDVLLAETEKGCE